MSEICPPAPRIPNIAGDLCHTAFGTDRHSGWLPPPLIFIKNDARKTGGSLSKWVNRWPAGQIEHNVSNWGRHTFPRAGAVLLEMSPKFTAIRRYSEFRR